MFWCALIELPLQHTRSFSFPEFAQKKNKKKKNKKPGQIFLHRSQGEANVFSVFIGPLGTSRSF